MQSIPVPSVQELAKKSLTKVPDQYVIPEGESVLASNATSLPQVPVIDLSKLLSKDLKELEKLNYACKEWGFFQLVNHGVSTSLTENMKRGTVELFELPMEEKKKLWQTEGDIYGFGQAFVFDEKQKLEWADGFLIASLPTHLRNPRIFNQLPQLFRESVDTYSVELKNLAIKMMKIMGIALAIDPNELTEIFTEGTLTVRINYYPPCPEPDRVIGLKAHSDLGGLTMLLQTNDVQGLQVRKDGLWIPINPLPGAFIINVGDQLEIVTNGIYRSNEHRATVNSESERISITTFYGADLKATLAPTPSLVTPERPIQFESISVKDHVKRFFSRDLQGKSYLETMRIKNGSG
ncbi:hypothetical protein RJT34_03887 [Clitoria ternatea]|uniref:Fe2OG dioxygenase domain-containing protein n=1 Tax=Clitoria ternatea TaxID=43366 RepID=A0AAN9KKZ4_CLITE